MAEVVVLKGSKGVQALLAGVQDLKPALKGIGAYLVSQTQAGFRLQKRKSSWATRITPNIPGIVADLNKGSNPPKRRFVSRPALIDTGRLRNSWTFLVQKNEVKVGTKVPYASIHQTGGVTRHQLTQFGRKNLVLFLRRRKDLRKELGWLFGKPQFTVRVQKREMLAVTPDDVKVIDGILEDYLKLQQGG